MEAALEALDTVGDVTVERHDVGVATTVGPSQAPMFSAFMPPHTEGSGPTGNTTTNHALTYWTVAFDKPCDSAKAWQGCPADIGAAPLLVADDSGLESKRSPYAQQISPQTVIRRTKPGTKGNDREDGSDLNLIHARLEHATAGVNIDNYEVQAIDCVSPGLDGSFDLTFQIGRASCRERV